MRRVLERRWLHYALLSRDSELGMVSNTSWLGPPPEALELGRRLTSILLIYRRDQGWSASQFNTETLMPLWSAFRQPHPYGVPGRFELRATSGSPSVHLKLERTSRPCTSQCAPFAGDQHLRWQSETGILARGDWRFGDVVIEDVDAIGLSMLSGAHMTLAPLVVDEVRKRGSEIPVILGGIVPDHDLDALREAGIDTVLTPGATSDEIVREVEAALATPHHG